MIQSSKYLLKAHYVLGPGNTKVSKVQRDSQFNGGNRYIEADSFATMGLDLW